MPVLSGRRVRREAAPIQASHAKRRISAPFLYSRCRLIVRGTAVEAIMPAGEIKGGSDAASERRGLAKPRRVLPFVDGRGVAKRISSAPHSNTARRAKAQVSRSIRKEALLRAIRRLTAVSSSIKVANKTPMPADRHLADGRAR